MKLLTVTRMLRVLLILLLLVCLFVFVLILPLLAAEQVVYYPELAHIEKPMLFITRLLLALFMLAVVLIIGMTFLYEKEGAYTQRFLLLLRILSGLGFAGAAGVIGVFFFLSGFGGPGSALGLLMIGGTICILIVTMVLLLIHRIVSQAMVYKDTFDTTV